MLTWISLKNIIKEETRHKRPQIVGFHIYKVGKPTETEKGFVVARVVAGWGGRRSNT